MKKQYTKEERAAYFAGLRDQWNAAKNLSEDQKQQAEAIFQAHGLKCSMVGFWITYMQMQQQGFDGIPYVDARTFQGWKESGFQVRKGEKSTLSGLTWISVTAKDQPADIPTDAESGFMFPKEYHLFHRSQVEPIL